MVVALFDDLAAILDSDRSGSTCRNHKEAAVLMLKVDRRRAANVLLHPERFHPGNRACWDIIEALIESGERVSPKRLLPLLEALWEVKSDHPRYWAMVKGDALQLAARVDDPACRAYIDRAMYSGDADLADQAAHA